MYINKEPRWEEVRGPGLARTRVRVVNANANGNRNASTNTNRNASTNTNRNTSTNTNRNANSRELGTGRSPKCEHRAGEKGRGARP